jgi:hypothetical protein
MGVSTNYLGHVEIVPSLNQAEYDYLHAFARTRRSYRPDRELSLLRVEANEVISEILRRGDPVLPWEPGYQGLDDRPWLAGEPPWRSSLDFPPPPLEQIPLPSVDSATSQDEGVIHGAIKDVCTMCVWHA